MNIRGLDPGTSAPAVPSCVPGTRRVGPLRRPTSCSATKAEKRRGSAVNLGTGAPLVTLIVSAASFVMADGARPANEIARTSFQINQLLASTAMQACSAVLTHHWSRGAHTVSGCRIWGAAPARTTTAAHSKNRVACASWPHSTSSASPILPRRSSCTALRTGSSQASRTSQRVAAWGFVLELSKVKLKTACRLRGVVPVVAHGWVTDEKMRNFL